MTLPKWLVRRLFARMRKIAASRPPDVRIGKPDDDYMLRWWVIPRNRFFNIYLHNFLRSDDDRALHDHPWLNMSLLLDGRYTEHTIADGGVHHRVEYAAGAIKLRGPKYAHRVELTHGSCWSLFITGPVMRDWGFHCPQGWRHHTQFVDRSNSGQIGRGCD
ncbi:hypothetical protein X566_20010 [Afipia sp. P52-10]|uniref:hypothetical protein n=1 Tax=Afipia sp. P52-10 TaxID=1429916 RepID=UPI0003DF145B|nr:hypothetical protein [Afipia sp. P52-10]ETR75055.1 hypothetical protein X566_20010 [Afipia sp. P52-10]